MYFNWGPLNIHTRAWVPLQRNICWRDGDDYPKMYLQWGNIRTEGTVWWGKIAARAIECVLYVESSPTVAPVNGSSISESSLRMHGPLDEHLHSEECNVIIRELQRCHQVPLKKRKSHEEKIRFDKLCNWMAFPGEQYVQAVFWGVQPTWLVSLLNP